MDDEFTDMLSKTRSLYSMDYGDGSKQEEKLWGFIQKELNRQKDSEGYENYSTYDVADEDEEFEPADEDVNVSETSVDELIKKDRAALRKVAIEITKALARSKRFSPSQASEDMERILDLLEMVNTPAQRHLDVEQREEVLQIRERWKA